MIPIYFPFTYVPEPMANALAGCFPGIIIFQAWKNSIPSFMRDMAKKGLIDLKTPLNSDEDRLNNLVKAYKQWAAAHKGSELAFFKAHKEAVPFFDDTSSHGIRNQIKKTVSGKKNKEKEKIDPVLVARLFLCMAHEYDMDACQVDMELDKIKKLEEKFLENLTGGEKIGKDDFNIRASLALKDDPGAHMTEERLDAWARLAAPESKDAKIFVTGSKAVIDVILDRCDKWNKILEIKRVNFPDDMGFCEKLKAGLEKILKGDESEKDAFFPLAKKDEKTDFSISLAFYKMELSGHSFFDLCFKHRKIKAGSEKTHAIAGLISSSQNFS